MASLVITLSVVNATMVAAIILYHHRQRKKLDEVICAYHKLSTRYERERLDHLKLQKQVTGYRGVSAPVEIEVMEKPKIRAGTPDLAQILATAMTGIVLHTFMDRD